MTLQDLKDKAEWEGGLAEFLLYYGGSFAEATDLSNLQKRRIEGLEDRIIWAYEDLIKEIDWD